MPLKKITVRLSPAVLSVHAPLTVTAGSATITEGDALPTELVTCSGLLDSEGRTDDRDTVLDNAPFL